MSAHQAATVGPGSLASLQSFDCTKTTSRVYPLQPGSEAREGRGRLPLQTEEAEIDLASARPDSGVAALLGRDDELALLYDLIDGIGQRGGALVVRGEAGIGKSMLLEAAAVRARERDVTVVSATSFPSEARFAFAGLHQLLLPFLDARNGLPQTQRLALETAIGLGDGDAPDPFLVGLAVLCLLAALQVAR